MSLSLRELQLVSIREGMKRTDGIAGDAIAALGLLTRLPLPGRASHRGAEAAWAWPLAGLTVALLAAVLVGIGGWIGLPVTLCAGLLIVAMVVMTGALHEDGLADVADGFWGGFTTERRLEIMKDSRTGVIDHFRDAAKMLEVRSLCHPEQEPIYDADGHEITCQGHDDAAISET